MNPGVLVVAGGGQLVGTNLPPVAFNGGTPARNNGALCIAEAAPQTFVHGLGYLNDGRVCVAFGGTIAGRSKGGIPMTADGRVCVSAGQAVSRFMRALPIDSAGRIAFESQPGGGTPPSTSGFDSGFTNGYG